MEIYWIDKDKKRRGPVTVPDMISMVRRGELSKDETLGWHAGATGWLPLRDLPALTDFLTERTGKHITYDPNNPLPELDEDDTPAPAAAAEHAATPPTEADIPQGAMRLYLPRPHVRLLARLVDMGLYTTLVFLGIYLLKLPFNQLLLPSGPLFWLGMLVLEPLLLCTLGTTPGKHMFGIRVRHLEPGTAGTLTFRRAAGRTMFMFVMGLGMMFSLLPVLAMLISRWQLRTRGITAWDAHSSTLPVQERPVPATRGLLAVLVLFCCVQLTSVFMAPWQPAMLDMISDVSPEWGEKLRALSPEAEPAAPPAPAPATPADTTETPLNTQGA